MSSCTLLSLVCIVVVSLSLGPQDSAAWNYGADQVRGVNLGSWLILEKWMTPSVFAGAPDSVNDEYQLCRHLGPAEAERRLKAHWDSWITEADFVQMKNAGVNHVRIPIGYWAFDIREGTFPLNSKYFALYLIFKMPITALHF